MSNHSDNKESSSVSRRLASRVCNRSYLDGKDIHDVFFPDYQPLTNVDGYDIHPLLLELVDKSMVLSLSGRLIIRLQGYQEWVCIYSAGASRFICDKLLLNTPVNYSITAVPMVRKIERMTWDLNFPSRSICLRRRFNIVKNRSEDNTLVSIDVREEVSYRES